MYILMDRETGDIWTFEHAQMMEGKADDLLALGRQVSDLVVVEGEHLEIHARLMKRESD